MEKHIEHINEKKEGVVTTNDIGARVKRGKDWEWDDQDKGAVYGTIETTKECDLEEGWVWVNWYDAEGDVIYSNEYRIGDEDKYDLYYL